MSYYSITLPGSAECIHEVRTWTQKSLGDAQGVDDVVLIASELAANAVRHSASGQPGGTFTLQLGVFTDRWQVRVDDDGGADEPRVQSIEDDQDEAGRGLAMVASLSSSWGVLGDHRSRGVWAEIPMPLAAGLRGSENGLLVLSAARSSETP